MSEEPLLQPEEVASVLGSDDGSGDPGLQPTDESTTPYSMRQPLTLAPHEEPEARRRAEKIIGALQRALQQELDGEHEITIEGFQQQRADSALTVVPEPAWTLAMTCPPSGGMLLVLNPTLALALVEMAMGGVGNAPENGRAPTPLEVRVIERLAAGLVSRINRQMSQTFAVQPVSIGKVPRSFGTPGEIVGVTVLRIKVSEETERNSVLLLSTGLLRGSQDENEGAEEPDIGALGKRLLQLSLATRPVLAAGCVTMRELSELKPGAMLQFDRDAETALDLRIAGQTVFTGRLSREEKAMSFNVDWRRGAVPEEKSATEEGAKS